jgi:D-glycero-D-manno-heptose 1,7-bisphosphate phosphatase
MEFKFDNTWTLFLDRDGVINEKLENEYVKSWDEFIFKKGVLEAITDLSNMFTHIFIVTNQRGVGLGKMTEVELNEIHKKMLVSIEENLGKIDKIYHCSDAEDSSLYRKPNIGMGLLAKQDFPEIEFSKSIMVGDSISDMEFGEKLGMKCVLINSNFDNDNKLDYLRFNSLLEFKNNLKVGENY